MALYAMSHSSYPRVGDKPGQQILRKAISLWEKGSISDKKLLDIQKSVIKEVIKEQEKAKIDILTDGQITWYDPVSHIVKNATKIDGLLRFFDTNFYFRQPIFSKTPMHLNSTLLDEFNFARKITPKPIKPVLTGPYTIANLSIIKKIKFLTVVDRLTNLIAYEIKKLSNAGAKIIQIEEPSSISKLLKKTLFTKVIKILSRYKNNSKIALCFYFADCAPYYEFLQNLDVDILCFDITYSPALLEIIRTDGSIRSIGFGIIDGRNTKIENPEKLSRIIEKTAKKISGDIYIHTSCGLEYLPRDVAYKKLAVVSKIAKLLTR
jgi:5-methyltetrahydropteroyltriglutamate--homocysteine methyltransferase